MNDHLIHPQDLVRGYTQPIYDWVFAHLKEIIIIVTIVIFLRLFSKILKRLQSKRYKNKQAGSTNDWFSWEKYHEWKENRQKHEN